MGTICETFAGLFGTDKVYTAQCRVRWRYDSPNENYWNSERHLSYVHVTKTAHCPGEHQYPCGGPRDGCVNYNQIRDGKMDCQNGQDEQADDRCLTFNEEEKWNYGECKGPEATLLCRNGGTCFNVMRGSSYSGGKFCYCPPGWGSRRCETRISTDPTQHPSF